MTTETPVRYEIDESDLEAIIDQLHEDGDTADLTDRLRLKLRIEHDSDTSIRDFDCYGKTERYAHRYTDGESRTPRPDGFDGSARKIEVDRGYWIWWQPADDLKSFRAWGGGDREVYEQAKREHYETARRLLQEGFVQLGVELHEKCDHGHWHEVASAWLGGIDDPRRQYLREVIEEQIYELEGVEVRHGR